MKKKIKVLLGMASLMVATMIGSTWATDTKSIMTGNEFQTAYYQTELVEEFTSPDDWKPGMETEKMVWLENTGEVPAIVRAVLKQEWIRTEDVEATLDPAKGPEKIPPLKGEKYPSLKLKNGEYAAQINFNEDAVVMLRTDDSDENPFGVSYVDSMEEAKGKWLLASEEPDANGNWYVYYIGVVEPESETPVLIESVTMNPKVENTIIRSRTYYEGDKQITVDEVNSESGYDCAEYTLTVTMTTVQATKDAVGDVFKKTHKEIVDYLITDVAQTGIYKAEGEKVLTMKEKDGTLGYMPQGAGSKTEGGNWFMSFTDMIPGGIYKDEMKIKNDTYYNFYLYMQAIPRDQSEVKDELLELITMKVYHDGTLIYDGTASGAKNAADVILQDKVALGLHYGQKDSRIEVELQLDPDMNLDDEKYLDKDGNFKYADVLSKTDWKFWVVRKVPERDPDPKPTKPTTPTTPTTPTVPTQTDIITDDYDPFGVLGENYEMYPVGVLGATGDDTPIVPVVAAMLVCAGVTVFVVVRRKKGSYEE